MPFPFFLHQACAGENLEKERDFAYFTVVTLKRGQQTPERQRGGDDRHLHLLQPLPPTWQSPFSLPLIASKDTLQVFHLALKKEVRSLASGCRAVNVFTSGGQKDRILK